MDVERVFYKYSTSCEVGWGVDVERVFYKDTTSSEVGWMWLFDGFSTNIRFLTRSGDWLNNLGGTYSNSKKV